MHSAEDYSTFEEIGEFFAKKVSLAKECIELKYADPGTMACLQNLENNVVELQSIFQQIRTELKAGQNKLKESKEYFHIMESLNFKLDRMQKDFPAVLKPTSIPQVSTKSGKTDASATPVASKHATKVPAKIKCLTTAEFEAVPKYMKGRIQYTHINDFINSFNATIMTKYKLLTAPRKTMKQADFKVCSFMKSQETDETKGKYFCTGENLKEYGKQKMDKTTNNFLTILRHCGRIKEIRGPGSLTRYLVVS